MKNIHVNLNEFRNASRVLKQTKSLLDAHLFNEVTIIAMGSDDLPEYEQIEEQIRLHRLNLVTRKLPKSFIWQFIKYAEFFLRSNYLIFKLKPSVINAHSLGALPIVLPSKLFLKSKVVYDTHELETERNGLHGIRKKISKVIEKQLIQYVDLILVVSKSISEWYSNEYDIPKPVVILNTPKLRKLKRNNYFREKLNIREDQIILLYQGGLFNGRGIELILDTFKDRLSDEVVVVFMGYGPLEREIKSATQESNNIFFYPAVSPQDVLEYTSSADIGISIIENVCLSYYYCMPNKLFEYSMAGLPVIVSNMKDMSNLVKSNNMGLILNDLTCENLNEVLDILTKSNLSELKKNAYSIAVREAWETQENKMISLYKKLLKIT